LRRHPHAHHMRRELGGGDCPGHTQSGLEKWHSRLLELRLRGLLGKLLGICLGLGLGGEAARMLEGRLLLAERGLRVSLWLRRQDACKERVAKRWWLWSSLLRGPSRGSLLLGRVGRRPSGDRFLNHHLPGGSGLGGTPKGLSEFCAAYHSIMVPVYRVKGTGARHHGG